MDSPARPLQPRADHGITVPEAPCYEIVPAERIARYQGREIGLTNRDYDLLLYLFQNSHRVITRGELLEAVWQRPAVVETRTVDVHIARVRKALNEAGDTRVRIKAKYRAGYCLDWSQVAA